MDIVHSIVVQNSLSEVFKHLREFVTKSEADVTTKGTRFSEAFTFLGKKRKFQFEITQLIPNRGIKARTTNNKFPIEESFEVVPDAAGTRILWKVHIKPQGMDRMFSSVIKNNISKQLDTQLAKLKDTLDFRLMSKTTLAFGMQNNSHWL